MKQPRAPKKPEAPQEFYCETEEKYLYSLSLPTHSYFTLDEDKIPPGTRIGSINIKIETYSDHDDYYDVTVFVLSKINVRNPRYESMLEQYESDMKIWEIKHKKYLKDLQEFKSQKDKQKDEELQNRLKEAEAFLVKHGRIVTQ